MATISLSPMPASATAQTVSMSPTSEFRRLKKSKNFTSAENNVLVEEVELRKELLFSKLNNSITNRIKQDAWDDISKKVNSVNSSASRTALQVKKHWQDMQSRTKKKESERRREMRKTGGGPSVPPLSDMEDKVVSILGETAIEGIQGGEDTLEVPVEMEDEEITSILNLVPEATEVPASLNKPSGPKNATLEMELLLCEQKRQVQEGKKISLLERLVDIKEKEFILKEQSMELKRARFELEKKRFELENSRSLFPVPVFVNASTEE